MAAYLIVEHIITDADKFEEYRTKVGPLIAKHGGRYLTKGGSLSIAKRLAEAEELLALIVAAPINDRPFSPPSALHG
jgi:uncharacterized protein (DUF1330 family)